jgi:hypothetical protein
MDDDVEVEAGAEDVLAEMPPAYGSRIPSARSR